MAATLAVDTSGRISQWSRQAEQLLGYSATEAIGQSIELIIPAHLRGRHSFGFARYVKTGVSHLPEIATSPAVHKSGEIVKMDISVKAVYGENHTIIAVQATMAPSKTGS
jgi:PAS domain S-box-containing protein